MGGVAMSFHFDLLYNTMGGVPITVAIGDPVSGKSTAVEAAMAIFNQRDSIGSKL
jgi:predicted ATPase